MPEGVAVAADLPEAREVATEDPTRTTPGATSTLGLSSSQDLAALTTADMAICAPMDAQSTVVAELKTSAALSTVIIRNH